MCARLYISRLVMMLNENAVARSRTFRQMMSTGDHCASSQKRKNFKAQYRPILCLIWVLVVLHDDDICF